MPTPMKFWHSSTSGNPDFSKMYAEKTGHILEFYDARNAANFVEFIAFLSSFSQTFTSNWNTQEVIGRMDSLATFKNTTRTISVAWELPSGDLESAADNLNRCNQLVNLLYPSYEEQRNALVMSKPPLVRVKYANLIHNTVNSSLGLLGYITSVNWTPVLEMGYYSSTGTGSDGTISKGDARLYPKVISLSVEFNVIHETSGDNAIGYKAKDNKRFGLKEGADANQKLWPFNVGVAKPKGDQ